MELAFVALGLSIVCNVALALFVRKALPAAIVRDHRIIRTEIERVHDQVEGLQTRWAAKVIELTNLADECADHMNRAEKKRRQTAGERSRMKGNEEGADLSTQSSLLRLAHDRGLM